MKLIDLTHAVNVNTPVYPGDPKTIIEVEAELSKQGYNDHKLTFGTHVGTHLDAAAHMIAGGKPLKDYPIERFVVPGICIDARSGYDAAAIRSAGIEPGMAVLFCTGASSYYYEEKYWHEFFVLSDDCCQALIEKQVGMVGVDTGSADNAEGFPVHKALLGAEIIVIENLANLDQVVGKSFELLALPIKLEDDGAPARVIARLI